MKKGNRYAIKHGVYAEMIILPGEDPDEFKALHQSLIKEWDPQGVSQEDKVISIAQNIWRKRRSGRYRKDHAERADWLGRQEEKEFEQLVQVLEDIENKKIKTERDLLIALPAFWAGTFHKLFARKNYKSDADWLGKVMAGVEGLLDRMVCDGNVLAKNMQIEFSDPEVLTKELALEERIDAKIDRDIMALGRMKTMQSMGLGYRPASATTEVPKNKSANRIDSPPTQPEQSAAKVESKE